MLSSQSAVSLGTSTIRACVKTYIICWLEKVAAWFRFEKVPLYTSMDNTSRGYKQGEKDFTKNLQYMKMK